MSGERPTPPNGVQLIDRSQWRAIYAVGALALVALALSVAALRRPSPAAARDASPTVHVTAPACPAAPPCPPCAACPACPSRPERRHRD